MFMRPLDLVLAVFFNLFAFTLGYMPLWAVQFASWLISLFLYPFVGVLFGLRRRVVGNLRAAYGDSLTNRQAKKIGRRVVSNQLLFFMEAFFYYHERNGTAFRQRVSVEGLENVAAARKGSKGVIGVTGHFGNFQLMMLRLSLEDSRFITLIRQPKSRVLSSAWANRIDDFGLKKIMMKNRVSATKEIMRELRRSAFIMFIADEYTRRGGDLITFFGKKTAMAAGPAQLSLRMGIPLLPCFIIREDTGLYRIIIEKAIEITPTGDRDADSLALTQKRIEILERYIRLYTDHWLWTQSRWKKRRYGRRQGTP